MHVRVFLIGLLLALGIVTPAAAHEIRPAIVDIGFDGDDDCAAPGQAQRCVRVRIDLNLEAAIGGIQPQHKDTDDSDRAELYNGLRALPPALLQEKFAAFTPDLIGRLHLTADGIPLVPRVVAADIPAAGDISVARESQVTVAAPLPPDAQSVVFAWDASLGPVIVRARGAPTREAPEGPVVYAGYLKDGIASEPIPVAGEAAQPWTKVFANYLEIGFTHIVPKGLDHILFVVGLFLLSPKLAPLAWQVTAFTLAHSVTLALGVLGLVRLPPSIVEPLIAASIVYVAVENMVSDKLQKWRPAVVFGFGLLHGLGFAGVLADVGLQRGHFVTGLVAFNLGVELGQLAVVVACFLVVGLWFRDRSFYRSAVTMPASLAIALVGAWWFVERIGLV